MGDGGPLLVTAGEVAKALRLSPSSVYRYAQSGAIPSIRVEGSVRFDLDAVRSALEGENYVRNHRVEAARRLREKAMEAAEHTWVFEVPGMPGSVVIVAHPGQEPESDPAKLRSEYGLLDPSKVIRLSDSWAAPRPFALEDEIAILEHQLAEAKSALARRGEADES